MPARPTPWTDARSVKRPLRREVQRVEKLPSRWAVAVAAVVHDPEGLSSSIRTVRPRRRAGTLPRNRSDRLTSAPGLALSTISPSAGAAAPPVGAVVAVAAAARSGTVSAPAASRAQASVACRRASLIVSSCLRGELTGSRRPDVEVGTGATADAAADSPQRTLAFGPAGGSPARRALDAQRLGWSRAVYVLAGRGPPVGGARPYGTSLGALSATAGESASPRRAGPACRGSSRAARAPRRRRPPCRRGPCRSAGWEAAGEAVASGPRSWPPRPARPPVCEVSRPPASPPAAPSRRGAVRRASAPHRRPRQVPVADSGAAGGSGAATTSRLRSRPGRRDGGRRARRVHRPSSRTIIAHSARPQLETDWSVRRSTSRALYPERGDFRAKVGVCRECR